MNKIVSASILNANFNNLEEGPTNSESPDFVFNVGYEFDGNSVVSSTALDDTTIMVYTGDKPYTIIFSEARAYSEVVVFNEYNNFEILECGLCLLNDNSMKYYIEDIEVTIYSNALTIDEYLTLASSITVA